MNCKHCQSEHVIKWGSYNGVPRYYCNDCHRKFKGDSALPGMRIPVEQVADALNRHYNGESLHAIARSIGQNTNTEVSDVAVYKWIDRFTNSALKMTRDLHPMVGNIWVADEMVVKVAGHNVWLFDVMDAKTRYLLATRWALSRTTHDAQSVMEEAAKVAGKHPKGVVTDRLSAYNDGIDLAFGGDTEHEQGSPFQSVASGKSTARIERLHGSIRSRTKVMRGLKDVSTAADFAEGWAFNYNYIRPHEALGNKTPAEAAGIKFPYRNWAEVVKHSGERVTVASAPVPHYEPPRVPSTRRTLGLFAKHSPMIGQRPPRITPKVGRLR